MNLYCLFFYIYYKLLFNNLKKLILIYLDFPVNIEGDVWIVILVT